MFLAWTEIRRSAGRFSLLIAAVALLVLLLLFFQAVAGTLTSGLTGAYESSTAEVYVYDDRARRNPSASVLEIDTADDIEDLLGVSAASPVGAGVFTAIGPDGEDVDVAVFGIEPDGAFTPAQIADGRTPGASGEAIFSGSSFDAPLALDDRITLGGQEVEVVGIADGAAFNILPTLYVPFDTYAQAVKARAGVPIDVPASFVGVTLAGSDADDVARAITTTVDGVEAVTRATAISSLPGAGQVSQSFNILYLLLYVVVTIVTAVFFLILTVQKSDALVLLRAVGASPRDVVVPVLQQVVFVVGVGAVIGTGAATGLLAATRDTFGGGVSSTTALTTIGAILALGLVASIGAVRRVLSIDPVEAVQGGGI